MRLSRNVPPGADALADLGGPKRSPKAALRRLKQRELGQQDKAIGLAELADAIETDRPHFPAPDFTLHLTELTLAIQAAGTNGGAYRLTTSFVPPELRGETLRTTPDYAASARPGVVNRLIEPFLERAHRH